MNDKDIPPFFDVLRDLLSTDMAEPDVKKATDRLHVLADVSGDTTALTLRDGLAGLLHSIATLRSMHASVLNARDNEKAAALSAERSKAAIAISTALADY